MWQWWVGDPIPRYFLIPADGWVVDPYFTPNPRFRQHIRKYVITGAPVIIMPWATAEHPDPYWAGPITPERWKANDGQLDVAVEFNLPVAFYWCYRGGTTFKGNRGEPRTEIDKINHWVWNYIKRVRALPMGYEGLESADGGAGKAVEICKDVQDGKLVYEDDFSHQKCVDDATMAGFRDLVMDGKTLIARGFNGRKVDAELTYHVAAERFSARYPAVSMTAITNKQLSGRVEVELSSDEKTWPHRTSVDGDGEKRLELSSSSDSGFASLREFWVRVRLRGEPGSESTPPVRIDDLRIEAAADALSSENG